MMPYTHCPHCGKELTAQGKFCKYCGCLLSVEMNENANEPTPEIWQQQKTNIKNRLLGACPKLSIAAAVIAVMMVIGVISIAIGNSYGNHNNTDFTADLISADNSDADMTGHYQQIYIKGENSELTETDIKALRDTGNDKDLFDLNVYSDDTARMTTKNGGDISFTIKDDGFYMSDIYKCPYSYSQGVITLEVPVKGITMKFRKVR